MTAEKPGIVHLRGENGVIHMMTLPLHEAIADKLAKGYLTRVNEDGTPYVDPHAQGSDLTRGIPARPAVNAPKAEWVGYAVHALGKDPDTVDGMTKQDIIDMVNQLVG